MEAIKLQLANRTLLKHSAPQWKRAPLEHVALRGTDPETQPSPYVRAVWAGKRVGAVRTISVQAAYNRQNLFFRLEWPDATHNPDYGDGLVFPDAAANIAAAGVTLHVLTDWATTLEVAERNGALTGAAADEVRAFLADPAAWSQAHGGA